MTLLPLISAHLEAARLREALETLKQALAHLQAAHPGWDSRLASYEDLRISLAARLSALRQREAEGVTTPAEVKQELAAITVALRNSVRDFCTNEPDMDAALAGWKPALGGMSDPVPGKSNRTALIAGGVVVLLAVAGYAFWPRTPQPSPGANSGQTPHPPVVTEPVNTVPPPNSDPGTATTPTVKVNTVAGSIGLRLAKGNKVMPITLQANAQRGFDRVAAPEPTYTVNGDWPTGTEFFLRLTLKAPAYVYLLGYAQKDNELFWLNEQMQGQRQPAGDVRLPGATGTPDGNLTLSGAAPDHLWLCALVSQEILDIKELMAQAKSQKGAFPTRIKALLAGRIVSDSDISLSQDMQFSAAFAGQKTIAPLFLRMSQVAP